MNDAGNAQTDRTAVERLAQVIDAVLDRGADAQRRHEALAIRLDALRRVAGVAADPAQLPRAQRHVHGRVVQLTLALYGDYLGLLGPRTPTPAPPATVVRALTSRHRI